MKGIVLLLLSLLVMACNSGMENDAMKKADAVEFEETVAAEESYADEELPTTSEISIDYSEIVAQKLQEFVDLQTLIQKHPEFRTDLQLQIASLSSDNQLLQVTGDSIVIKDITQFGKTEIISDSVRRTPFSFVISSSNTFEKDSLIAVFTTREVEIDGEIFASNKVTFESLDK